MNKGKLISIYQRIMSIPLDEHLSDAETCILAGMLVMAFTASMPPDVAREYLKKSTETLDARLS